MRAVAAAIPLVALLMLLTEAPRGGAGAPLPPTVEGDSAEDADSLDGYEDADSLDGYEDPELRSLADVVSPPERCPPRTTFLNGDCRPLM